MPKYKIVIELETEQHHEPRFLEAALLMALGPKGIFPVGGTMRVPTIDRVDAPAPTPGGPTGIAGPIDLILDYRNREEP